MKLRHILVAGVTWICATWSITAQADEVFRPLYMAQASGVQPISFENLDNLSDTSLSSASTEYPAAAPGYSYATCRSGWRVGVEATFLAPMGGNQLSYSFVDVPNGTTESFSTDANGIDGLVPAPRLWMSYVCDNGWGVQFRYWELNTSSNYNNPFIPFSAPSVFSGDTFGFTSGTNLEMYALDLELVKEFCFYDWNMVGTFGYRHALRDTNEAISFQSLVQRPAGSGGGTAFFTGATSGIAVFEGDGLTFSLSGYRCSNCCYGLQWFWNARTSVLFGDTYAGALAHAQLLSPAGDATETTGGLAGASDALWIAEFQVGAQWSTQLKCIPGRFFARGAFEYQHWGEMGGAAGATATVGELNVGELTVNSLAPSDSLDLVGFAISTGIVW